MRPALPNSRAGRSPETHGRRSRKGSVFLCRKERNVSDHRAKAFSFVFWMGFSLCVLGCGLGRHVCVIVEFNFAFDMIISHPHGRHAHCVAVFSHAPIKDWLHQ